MKWVLAPLLLAVIATTGCGESKSEGPPLQISIIIPDGLTGFFAVWPTDQAGDYNGSRDVEMVIQGEETVHPLAMSLHEWHKLSVTTASGISVPVHGDPGNAVGSKLISIGTRDDGRNLFLIGSLEERGWYHEIGGPLLSVRELNERLQRRRSEE